jgi:hypothetical protein
MDIQSDLSRVITSGKKSLKGGPLNITTAFECGAGIDIMRLSADHYSLVIPADPPSIPAAKGYNYYFCVRLLNKSSEIRSVTLDALRPGYIGRKTEWYASCVPVFISEDFRAWYVLDDVKASENHEEYRCVVTLQPGQTVHLSNSLPYPHQSIRTCLRQVQTEQSIIAKIVNLGHSVEGREILLLSITDPQIDESSKDRMLVTSGFHPAEPDWLATTAIIETLLLDPNYQ